MNGHSLTSGKIQYRASDTLIVLRYFATSTSEFIADTTIGLAHIVKSKNTVLGI